MISRRASRRSSPSAEARLESEAFAAWQGARKEKDFSAFAPKLKEMFALKQRAAKITRPAVAEPYDGALDAFERGMTAARLDEIFAELRAGVAPAAGGHPGEAEGPTPAIDAPPEALKAAGLAPDEAAQAELSREIAIALGWQADNGRLDVSTHPFTGGAGPEDVRITTRYSDNWIEGLGATVHETGHALYEQGRDLGEEGRGLPASVALSMGVHESAVAALGADGRPEPRLLVVGDARRCTSASHSRRSAPPRTFTRPSTA